MTDYSKAKLNRNDVWGKDGHLVIKYAGESNVVFINLSQSNQEFSQEKRTFFRNAEPHTIQGVKLDHEKYNYWLPGMDALESMPINCERLWMPPKKWKDSVVVIGRWKNRLYRWPKDLPKTCPAPIEDELTFELIWDCSNGWLGYVDRLTPFINTILESSSHWRSFEHNCVKYTRKGFKREGGWANRPKDELVCSPTSCDALEKATHIVFIRQDKLK